MTSEALINPSLFYNLIDESVKSAYDYGIDIYNNFVMLAMVEVVSKT